VQGAPGKGFCRFSTRDTWIDGAPYRPSKTLLRRLRCSLGDPGLFQWVGATERATIAGCNTCGWTQSKVSPLASPLLKNILDAPNAQQIERDVLEINIAKRSWPQYHHLRDLSCQGIPRLHCPKKGIHSTNRVLSRANLIHATLRQCR